MTEELGVLHKAVASSTTQQEQQLKEMEEDMHSFVSTKTEVYFIYINIFMACLVGTFLFIKFHPWMSYHPYQIHVVPVTSKCLLVNFVVHFAGY